MNKQVEAKIEANVYILTAKLLYQENMEKAKSILSESELSKDEIETFLKNRLQVADAAIKGYFLSMIE